MRKWYYNSRLTRAGKTPLCYPCVQFYDVRPRNTLTFALHRHYLCHSAVPLPLLLGSLSDHYQVLQGARVPLVGRIDCKVCIPSFLDLVSTLIYFMPFTVVATRSRVKLDGAFVQGNDFSPSNRSGIIIVDQKDLSGLESCRVAKDFEGKTRRKLNSFAFAKYPTFNTCSKREQLRSMTRKVDGSLLSVVPTFDLLPWIQGQESSEGRVSFRERDHICR